MIREWGKVKLDAGIPRGISRLDLHAALCDHAQSAPQRVLWFEHLILSLIHIYYHFNLLKFLLDSGYAVALINPITTDMTVHLDHHLWWHQAASYGSYLC